MSRYHFTYKVCMNVDCLMFREPRRIYRQTCWWCGNAMKKARPADTDDPALRARMEDG